MPANCRWDLIRVNTGCPTRYRNRHFFNNSNTNEDIAKKFEQQYVRCVENEEECVCSVPNIYICIQCVPLATEPSISLIILTPMEILQRNLNKSTLVVWKMKRNVSVVRLIYIYIYIYVYSVSHSLLNPTFL